MKDFGSSVSWPDLTLQAKGILSTSPHSKNILLREVTELHFRRTVGWKAGMEI